MADMDGPDLEEEAAAEVDKAPAPAFFLLPSLFA